MRLSPPWRLLSKFFLFFLSCHNIHTSSMEKVKHTLCFHCCFYSISISPRFLSHKIRLYHAIRLFTVILLSLRHTPIPWNLKFLAVELLPLLSILLLPLYFVVQHPWEWSFQNLASHFHHLLFSCDSFIWPEAPCLWSNTQICHYHNVQHLQQS